MATFLTDLTDQTGDALRAATAYVDDLTTPTLRLGVTGLSRAGKTVFITALVRTLTSGGAVPPISVLNLPGFRAFLEPQPDDDVPRFGYEEHLSSLTAATAKWPDSTRHISQLRVTMEWDAHDWLRQTAGIRRRLHLDIIDYPGEWLADIGLLEQDFATWSQHVSALAKNAPVGPARDAWLAFQSRIESATEAPEQVALEGARLFGAYLLEQKQAGRLAPSAGPGRFLMPGDYQGSPLLTFFPMTNDNSAVRALLMRRYESYKSSIVRPFFEKHFSRIDRQIVLVDVLGALNLGPAAVIEMENALERALNAFRPGRDSWLGRLLGQRINSILFAASKADHLHRRNHPRLQAILAKVVDRARARANDAGARISFAAIAALRTTEDVERAAGSDAPALECVRGIPLDGEMLNGKPLDPTKSLTVFPGDLPEDPIDAFDADIVVPGSLRFVRFRPRLTACEPGLDAATAWPHVGLDRAVAFLLGDRLR
ncbi:MAG: YcjX family protein [Hyphomicrobiaceae bacterium]